MTTRRTKISTGNVDSGVIVDGDGNSVHNVNVHETGVSKGLDLINDTLYEIVDRGRAVGYVTDREQGPSETLQSVFVSAVAGGILSWIWPSIMPWASQATFLIFFFTAITFSAFRVTNFSTRYSFFFSVLAGLAFGAWVNYAPQFSHIEDLVINTPIMGALVNALIASFFGLIASVILMFWRPLDI
ncbi:MAG: hypothetical protein HY869_20915 [Chloroflexi bacterium]|nr:hypothetical protein [Chloroflexota bacterium]